MEIFGYLISNGDVVISLGIEHSGQYFYGTREDGKNVCLGAIRKDGKISILSAIFKNFSTYHLEDQAIQLVESK